MNKPVLPMSSLSLKLPMADRSIETYRLAASRMFPAKLEGTLNRVAFSAAHVVADPFADNDPWLTSAIDWDRTIAFREHIWDLGLGVAEAMDTAQRGMGLDWPTSLELIQRSVKAAKAKGNALVFSGAGTDHLAVEDAKSIDDVIHAYEEQIAAVEPVCRVDGDREILAEGIPDDEREARRRRAQLVCVEQLLRRIGEADGERLAIVVGICDEELDDDALGGLRLVERNEL